MLQRFSTQVLLLIMLFVSSAVFATERTQSDTTIHYYNANNCNVWNYNSGGGTIGYLCASYPSTMQVPDAQSTQRVIDQLEARIKVLEAKLGN